MTRVRVRGRSELPMEVLRFASCQATPVPGGPLAGPLCGTQQEVTWCAVVHAAGELLRRGASQTNAAGHRRNCAAMAGKRSVAHRSFAKSLLSLSRDAY